MPDAENILRLFAWELTLELFRTRNLTLFDDFLFPYRFDDIILVIYESYFNIYIEDHHYDPSYLGILIIGNSIESQIQL